ncbi:MAG: 3-deoxy-D-manno-octulosonic-acid transferase [Candidatus Azotimanducaceae bacterium]
MFYLIMPAVYLRLFWRSIKEPHYRADLGHRMGRVSGIAPGAVWIHAVSAGETIAAAGLVECLLDAGHQVLLTNMTPAGRDRAIAIFGDRITSVYAPYDLPHAIRRFLRRVKPTALIIIDTELWPNMITLARNSAVPVYLVNGRLSERSAIGYGRIGSLSRPMFQSLTQVFAQTTSQAERFRLLGAPLVTVAGSIKFDAKLPLDFESRTSRLRAGIPFDQVLLGASTHAGEESLLLEAFLSLNDKKVLLVLAPRHTHRASEVIAQLEASNLSYQKHSDGAVIDSSTRVYLLDTMGELIYFYGICDVAFVGGSLVDVGGHNPMEPAGLGKPVIMGPYRRNIADIAEQFIDEGALKTVSNAESIDRIWRELLTQPDLAAGMSQAALNVMMRNGGALQRVSSVVLPRLAINSD